MGTFREIEKGIKPLVDILNEVRYIETNQSCEGHYDSEDYEKYNALVGFYVENEKEFMNLAKLILFETGKHCFESDVVLYNHFYVVPDETKKPEDQIVREQWILRMSPFIPVPVHNEPTEYEKREITNKTIKRIVDVVKKYLGR